jgi:hypothetical protein
MFNVASSSRVTRAFLRIGFQLKEQSCNTWAEGCGGHIVEGLSPKPVMIARYSCSNLSGQWYKRLAMRLASRAFPRSSLSVPNETIHKRIVIE